MSKKEQLDELIALVLADKAVEAYQKFYHDDVIIQEANYPPRVGLAASIEHATQSQGMVTKIHEVATPTILIDGERSIIEWHADWTIANGARIRIEEVALQTWRGDRISKERFFYDPAPLVKAGLLPDPYILAEAS